jgi:hypothetical protein
MYLTTGKHNLGKGNILKKIDYDVKQKKINRKVQFTWGIYNLHHTKFK